MENSAFANPTWVDELTPPRALLLNKCVAFTLLRFQESERETIIAWISEAVMTYNPSSIVTSEGLPTLSAGIFAGDILIRDFIFNLSAFFFSRLDITGDSYQELCRILAGSLTPFDVENKSRVAAPSEVYTRFESEEDIYDTLVTNRWLTTIIALTLYYDDDIIDIVIKKRKASSQFRDGSA